MKRTPLKRGRSKRKPSMAGFWAQVTCRDGHQCQLAHLGGCGGRLDAHHYLLAQRLPDSAKTDPRNGVTLCRDHHNAVHAPFKKVECPRPPLLDQFLADWDLLESGRPRPKRRDAA